MSGGVDIRSGAGLVAKSNVFINNSISLNFAGSTSYPYSAVVVGNQFYTTPSGLLYPALGMKGMYGIRVKDCVYLNVGDASVAANGNTFDNLRCGIKIEVMANSPILFNVFNGSFTNITGMTGTTLNDDRGACIHAVNFNQMNSLIPTVLNVSSVGGINNASFGQSEKGIVVDNFSANVTEVKMSDVFFGFTSSGNYYQQTVTGCTMDDVFYGVYSNGQLTANNDFSNNTISTKAISTVQTLGTFSSNITEGIRVDFPSTTPPPPLPGLTCDVQINSNMINVRSLRGIGIDTRFVQEPLSIRRNAISMNPPSSVLTLTTVQNGWYSGIYAQSATNATIERNRISGDQINSFAYSNNLNIIPLQTTDVGIPTGIHLLSFGSTSKLRCNSVSFMRYGILGRGLCGPVSVPNYNLSGNVVEKVGVGLFARQTLANGTLWGGNIGGGPSAIDNENVFIGPASDYVQVNPGVPVKVYVQVLAGQPCFLPGKTIRTDNITPGESISNSFNCEYVAISSVLNSFSCLSVPLRTTTAEGDSGVVNSNTGNGNAPVADENEVLAQELEARIHHLPNSGQASGAIWYEVKQIYQQIDDHQQVLSYSPLADSFYTALQGSDVARIREAERAYFGVMEAGATQDSTAYANAVANVFTRIADIIGVNTYAQNEKKILGYLAMIQCYGRDTLSNTDRLSINSLATSCILGAGPAVYNARYLYGLYHGPSFFDDDEICSPGVNARYSSIETNYQVYPNPAMDVVNIVRAGGEANDGQFEMRNITGTLVRSLRLVDNTQQISLEGLTPGLYFYQIFESGKMANNGKLIIKN